MTNEQLNGVEEINEQFKNIQSLLKRNGFETNEYIEMLVKQSLGVCYLQGRVDKGKQLTELYEKVTVLINKK